VIVIAAVIWAVLASILGVIAGTLCMRLMGERDEARHLARFYKRQRDDVLTAASERGRHARACQVQHEREVRIAKTAQLRREMGR
jgi:hypothetical protein